MSDFDPEDEVVVVEETDSFEQQVAGLIRAANSLSGGDAFSAATLLIMAAAIAAELSGFKTDDAVEALRDAFQASADAAGDEQTEGWVQ